MDLGPRRNDQSSSITVEITIGTIIRYITCSTVPFHLDRMNLCQDYTRIAQKVPFPYICPLFG